MSNIPRPTGKQTATAAAIAAMIAIAAPFIGGWEGKRNYPYRDLVGVLTTCFGETRGIENRYYSDAECNAMLAEATGDFGQSVLTRNPNLANRPYQYAAATSLAYNIGKAAYNRSTVARRFDAGDYRGACDAILMWNKAGGRVVKGLVNRRKAERELCLKGL